MKQNYKFADIHTKLLEGENNNSIFHNYNTNEILLVLLNSVYSAKALTNLMTNIVRYV